MAEESSEGVSYLMALKQSARPTSAAAESAMQGLRAEAQPGVGNPYVSAEQHQGAEKRRSPRYKCEGSAEVREEGCDVHTWATFTDVSMHGCYVEAQATYPVGTPLQMKLEANGIRVETKGDVRVSYPYLGMGIAFIETSEENKARLRQLLAKISHPCVIMGPGIASTLPANASLSDVPTITDAAAAVQALVEFFESRQMLMREDFLRILKQSQK